MDTLDAIHGRRSIRKYRDKPIPQDVLEQIIEAARWAPCGTQHDRRTLIVMVGAEKDEFIKFLSERLERLLPALAEEQPRRILQYARTLVSVLQDAAALVLFYTAAGPEGPELYLTSAAVSVQNLMLAAHAHGVGSCYTTGAIYLADEIADYLDMGGHRLVALVPLGYPADGVRERREFPRILWRGLEADSADDGPAEAADARVSGIERAPTGRAETVLIVDDSPGAAGSIAGALRDAGYEVNQCTEPSEALEVFQQVRPDLTIVDAILPEISGYELCRRMREAADGPCPVIVTTVAYDEADELAAISAGADDVLVKPVRAHELLARVHALLRVTELYEDLEQHARELADANERLRELDKLKDDLTHMIIHDLRTPLTNVITGLQTLEQMDYDSELTHELVPMAIEGAHDLSEMVNNLLDISKMESGELELDKKLFPVEDAVREAVSRVENLAEQSELTLVYDIEQGLQIHADRDVIVRVIVNLMGNAIKFTPRGGSITIGAERREQEIIVVGIRDTGEGIPEQELDRIFDKFHQVGNEKGARRTGTGLGLTFVKLAVESHGGRVWVESKLGEGSAFYFTLPVPT